MKETENDELTAVIQKLVLKYQDDILPIAVEMVTHLATIFQQVCCSLYLSCLHLKQVSRYVFMLQCLSHDYLTYASIIPMN